MSAITIDVNLVYKEAHRGLSAVTNTIELYHDQMLKLMEDNKNKDFVILELKKKIEMLKPNLEKVPKKPEPHE